MRKTFIDTLTELARKDKDVMLITGDLGYSVFEDFAKEFPKQFINTGIIEQSMVSIAAGLALSGKKPYIYSIIPFATMRPFEQIRNDICYQNVNVKIVGIGAGFAYGALASTHYAIEDIAILRSLPNLTLVSPADATETKSLILQTYEKPGPAYIRLLKPETKLVPEGVKTELSKPSVIQEGKHGVIISTGAVLELGLEVARKLKESGKEIKVISLHTLKPINEESLRKELLGQKHIFTIEEHRVSGGLGGIIAEFLFKNGLNNAILKTFGVGDSYEFMTGHQHHLAEHYGLGVDAICNKIISQLNAR